MKSKIILFLIFSFSNVYSAQSNQNDLQSLIAAGKVGTILTQVQHDEELAIQILDRINLESLCYYDFDQEGNLFFGFKILKLLRKGGFNSDKFKNKLLEIFDKTL